MSISSMRLSPMVLLGAIVVFAVAFSAIVAENSFDARRQIWSTARQLGGNMSRAVSEEIGRTLESLDLSLQAVVDYEQLPELRQLDTKLRNMLLFDRSAGAKNLSTILVLDAGGHVLIESRTGRPRDDIYIDREYFRAQRDNPNAGLFISAPFKGRHTPEWLFAISRRLKVPNGGFFGAVAGTVRLAPIRAFIQSLNLGPHGSFSVVRDDGTVMMRVPYRDAEIGANVRQSSVFQRALAGPEGQFVATATIDGIRRLHSFHRIEGTSLIVIASLAVDDIEAGWWHHTIVVGLGTLFVVASLIVIAVLLIGALRRREAAERAAVQSEAEAKNSAALFRLLAENSSDMVSRIGADAVRQYVSPACRQILGREPEDLVGHNPQEHIHPNDWDAFNALRARLSAGAPLEKLTYRVRHANGAWIWIESTVRSVFDPATRERDGVVAVSRDITERKLMETELAQLASLDGLTGIANRRIFDVKIENEWQRCARYEQPLSLLLVDVDRFKTLNDHYGHQYGDECLRQIGRLIGDAVRRANDVSARYGGEEFVILLPETDSDGAGAVAERLRREVEALAVPNVKAEDTAGIVTVSIGVATVRPQPHASSFGPADLIKMADDCLYAAKQAGRNQVMQNDGATLPHHPLYGLSEPNQQAVSDEV